MSVETGARGLTSTVEDAVTCAICLDVSIRPCTTSCGHSFCRRCLRAAISHDAQRRCPSCRQPLGRAFADELAINTALWAIIQAMFPQRCENAPASPALTAPPSRTSAGGSRPAQPLSRFAPQSTGTNTRNPRAFIPPRRTTAITSTSQRTDTRDNIAASLAALSLGGTSIMQHNTPERRHRNSRTIGSPGGASPVQIIDLTGEGERRGGGGTPRRESPAGLPPLSRFPRQQQLPPQQQEQRSDLFSREQQPRDGASLVPPQRRVVAGLFYSKAPSRREGENQAP